MAASGQAEQPRDFLYHLERHMYDDFMYSDDRRNTFVALALEYSLAQWDLQGERARTIIKAAAEYDKIRFDTAEQFITTFNRLREWIPKVQRFSLQVYDDAKEAFAGNAMEGDFRLSSALDTWQKETLDYLRDRLFAMADAAYSILKSSRRISGRWHDTIVNPDWK